MIEVRHTAPVTPEQVFTVLADGWSFSDWVVGTSHIRSVDPAWPAVGSRIHHSAGPWPVAIEDVTTVQAVGPDHLELDIALWPVGGGRARITLRPAPGGGTEICFAEELTRGPGRLVPPALQRVLVRPRNREALRRLAELAAGRRHRA